MPCGLVQFSSFDLSQLGGFTQFTSVKLSHPGFVVSQSLCEIAFLRPRLAGGLSACFASRIERRIQIREQLARERGQVFAARNQGEMLEPDRFAATLYSALVVPFSDPREVGRE